jgi:hypothetical protein
MTPPAEVDNAARAAAVERAAEAGLEAKPGDFRIDWELEGAVPGAHVFVASVPKQPVGDFVVPGLAEDGTAIVAPQTALTRAFQLWMEADGKLARPTDVALVASALYGAGHRAVVAVDEDSLELVRDSVPDEDAAALVSLPRTIEVDGQPGVELWWMMLTGVSRVRFYLDSRGIVATAQARPQELINKD